MRRSLSRFLGAAAASSAVGLFVAGCGGSVATQNAVAPPDPTPSGAQCNMTGDHSGALLAPYCDFGGQFLWTFDAYRGSLPYSKFIRSTVQCSFFIYANVAGGDFRNAELNGVSFDSADLTGANFSGANLGPYGKNCPGNAAYGPNSPKTVLTYANLRGANFTGAKITGVDLTGSKCSAQTVWTNGKPLPTPAGADPVGFDCPS